MIGTQHGSSGGTWKQPTHWNVQLLMDKTQKQQTPAVAYMHHAHRDCLEQGNACCLTQPPLCSPDASFYSTACGFQFQALGSRHCVLSALPAGSQRCLAGCPGSGCGIGWRCAPVPCCCIVCQTPGTGGPPAVQAGQGIGRQGARNGSAVSIMRKADCARMREVRCPCVYAACRPPAQRRAHQPGDDSGSSHRLT